MKTLIEHLCYLWMVHRPNELMFQKIAMIFSTTAKAGISNILKAIKIPLNFMGVKRIYSFGVAIAGVSWNNVSENKKQSIEKKLNKKAVLFYEHI